MTVGPINDAEFVGEFDVDSIQDKDFSSEEEQKLETGLQTASLKDSLERLRSETFSIAQGQHLDSSTQAGNQKLVDALAKYSKNQFRINALSYAIYMRDYDAALTMLKRYNPNKTDPVILRYYPNPAVKDIKYYLSPIDFLFVNKIEGIHEGASFIVPRKADPSRGIKQGQFTFKKLGEIDSLKNPQIRKLLGELLKRNQFIKLKSTYLEVREDCRIRTHKIDVYEELIQAHWNEILKDLILPSKNTLLNEAIFYDNHEFIEYTICKRQGDRYLESSLNFVLTHLGIGNPGEPISWEHEITRQTSYIIKLLDYGADPSVRGNDGKCPIDVLLNKRDSDRKRELLDLFFKYGVKP